MDALSEVLKVLHLTGGVFLDVEFTAPWCIDSSTRGENVVQLLPTAEHVVTYHLLTSGSCHVSMSDGGGQMELRAGDVIMFPHNDDHRMGTDLQLLPIQTAQMLIPSPEGGLMRIRHGGGGEKTSFICGFLACEKRLCKPLLDALPKMLRVSLSDDPASSWLVGAIAHGARETHTPEAGTDALISRLSELVFVQSIRQYIRSLPEYELGWLAGLRDPAVGKALALLHADPARRWEVESLAREVGISRSVLADRFVALIGEPPMQYLTRWRLALASRALSTRNDAIVKVADSVGYESEAAFNRAFKREYGLPPAAWRRTVRASRRLQ